MRISYSVVTAHDYALPNIKWKLNYNGLALKEGEQ